MPTIKFSHSYRKLLDNNQGKVIETALLVDVRVIQLETLHQDFIDYDTDNGMYKLPKKGDYLMLLFQKKECGEPANLFTTLRRRTLQKELYYSAMIGQTFKVEITAA